MDRITILSIELSIAGYVSLFTMLADVSTEGFTKRNPAGSEIYISSVDTNGVVFVNLNVVVTLATFSKELLSVALVRLMNDWLMSNVAVLLSAASSRLPCPVCLCY